MIDPVLQDRISKVVGYKMDRTVTLHAIGVGLYYKNVFPIGDTNEEKAKYVALMAGEEADALNMPRIEAEIADLCEALEQYRAIVERMVTNAELLRLSQRARQETQHAPGA